MSKSDELRARAETVEQLEEVKEQIEDVEGLECARRKTYGDSHISFFRSI